MKDYDIIIIGAGSGGLNIASFMNTLGLKVLLIEKHLIGGDCLNTGCVPSKALLSMAHTAASARKASKIGLEVTGTVDLNIVADTIAQRQEVFRRHENPDYLKEKGIGVEIGSPRFTSPGELEINGRIYSARRFVIATGSRPVLPPIEGIGKANVLTNETIFANRQLPGRLLIIGAGPVGIEIAQAYCRLGAQVTVVDVADRILPREDEEVSSQLAAVLEEEGIEFYLSAVPVWFSNPHTLIIKALENNSHLKEVSISFDRVLTAAGRQANIEDLGLDAAGVEVKNNDITVDRFLRTTNKKIYCCGDAAGDFQFTHWAEYHASIIIKNMLGPFKKKVNRSSIAHVIYTDPEVASFGLPLEELKDQYSSFRTIMIPVKDVDRAICEGNNHLNSGFLKIHHIKDKILGGTLMSKNAGEIIGELIGHNTSGIPFSHLYQRIYPYPTMSRIVRRAVQKHMGERLTPRVTGFLKNLYRTFNR